MAQGKDEKIGISLYEFYVMGINQLLKKAPWETGEHVSSFRQSFQYEQRLISLVILMLLGEEHVPESALKTMPSAREQARASINQIVFLRALTHYYQAHPEARPIAERALHKMESYVVATRYAQAKGVNPLEGIMEVLTRRVPPVSQQELEAYASRVQKILKYSQALIETSLQTRYTIQ